MKGTPNSFFEDKVTLISKLDKVKIKRIPEKNILMKIGCGDSPAGFTAGWRRGAGRWFTNRREQILAQSDFIVTGAGPVLLESGPDNFTLGILKHSTIFEKKRHCS